MEWRQLGKSGLKVSALGLGCNNFGVRLDEAGARTVVDAALDAGVTLFDTADVYGARQSEVILGKALGARRPDVVVATKGGLQGQIRSYSFNSSRRWILQAVEDSLRRLGTDYIDLYQIHMPDPHAPVEETLRALDDVVRQGKVRYIGCSNLAGWQVADAWWTARSLNLERFVSLQNPLSLIERDAEAEALPACERFGLGFLPYFPLASGLLTGKYRRGHPAPEGSRLARADANPRFQLSNERMYDMIEALTAFAEARGRTILDLAFAWLLANPVVPSVIAGAMSPAQVALNRAAVEWRLTPQEAQEVAALCA